MATFEQMQQDDTRKAIEQLDAILTGMISTGPNGDIAGYSYRADNHTPSGLIEMLIGEGRLAPGARGMDADEALDQLAATEGVNRADEYTFDTDEFPKVIRLTDISERDVDWLSR